MPSGTLSIGMLHYFLVLPIASTSCKPAKSDEPNKSIAWGTPPWYSLGCVRKLPSQCTIATIPVTTQSELPLLKEWPNISVVRSLFLSTSPQAALCAILPALDTQLVLQLDPLVPIAFAVLPTQHHHCQCLGQIGYRVLWIRSHAWSSSSIFICISAHSMSSPTLSGLRSGHGMTSSSKWVISSGMFGFIIVFLFDVCGERNSIVNWMQKRNIVFAFMRSATAPDMHFQAAFCILTWIQGWNVGIICVPPIFFSMVDLSARDQVQAYRIM